jgi:hypothetical protein
MGAAGDAPAMAAVSAEWVDRWSLKVLDRAFLADVNHKLGLGNKGQALSAGPLRRMALAKHPGNNGTTDVTFRPPAASGAQKVQLLGEFNDWTPAAMDPSADGGHQLTVPLVAGRTCRFRYLIDGERWENDRQADDCVANEFGGNDSVIDLTTVQPRAPDAVAAPKKARRALSTRRQATKAG